jgi:hypothetical protein
MAAKTNKAASITARALHPDAVKALQGKLGEEPLWQPLSQFHEDILTVDTDEVLVWGQKGSGKSRAAMVKACRGRQGLGYAMEEDGTFHPHRIWACWHPSFAGLVLRKNSEDLAPWFDQFMPLAQALGGVPTLQPREVRWPQGGVTRFGHMSDGQAWGKYVGNQQHMLIWEEAVLTEDLDAVTKILTCVRSSIPEIRPQVMLNCNPLGPGMWWIVPRFYRISPGDGYERIYLVDGKEVTGEDVVVEPKQLIEVRMRDRDGTYKTKTRSLLFGRLQDNPVQNTPEYRATLLDTDEVTQRAYLDGVVDFSQGKAFPALRLKGPQAGEPEEANHLWDHERILKHLEPWYPIHVGVDWGNVHQAVAIVWHAAEHDRLFAIDEIAQDHEAAEELGAQLGLRLRPYIQRGQSVTIHLAPDAFAVRSEAPTITRMIMRGLERTATGRIVLASDLEEKLIDWAAPQGSVGIRRANNQRVMGAEKIRGMLRWRPLISQAEGHPFSHETAYRIRSEEGQRAQEAYMKEWQRSSPEVLPKLILSKDRTPQLAYALRDAMTDPNNIKDVVKKHWAGADYYDAGRYGVMGYQPVTPMAPAEVLIRRQLEALRGAGLDPQSLHMYQDKLVHEQSRRQMAVTNFWQGRLSGSSRKQ